MKIVLVDLVPDDVLTTALAGNVIYRPDLLYKSATIVAASLEELSADAIIASSATLDAAVRTFAQGREVCQVKVTVGRPAISVEAYDKINSLQILHVAGDDVTSAYTNALDMLERRATTAMSVAPRGISSGAATRSVTLVGAGIVNLVTGYRLQEAGYVVSFVDAGADPQTDAHWTAYGCSRGGDDARMFTLSEMDNYNDKIVSPQMNGIFNGRVSELGWDVRRDACASVAEKRWLADFELMPVWLAKRYNVDIFVFNRESRSRWDSWIERDTNLFADSELREGILRLYSDPLHFEVACQRQALIGATQRVFSPAEVAAFQPALADAVAASQIAGGIVVTGFTVNVHKFMRGLVETMRERGATFDWDRRVTRMRLNETGTVTHLETGDGPIESDAYVISPGAYAQALLAGTSCGGKIHGVLGAWLRLPNIEPRLDRSLKLARRGHITEDANITVATGASGEPLMIIGSGYGHTGVDPDNVDKVALRQIHAGLVDTAQRFFPRAFEAARETGMLEASVKHCVRPWTATGLGLFEMLPTARSGRCIITGGHNTGGFAQAPAIASAVLAALGGRDHPMHRLYHPDRMASFMDRPRHACQPPIDGVEDAFVPLDRGTERMMQLSA